MKRTELRPFVAALNMKAAIERVTSVGAGS